MSKVKKTFNVLVDTNVLLMIYEGIDVFESIEELIGGKCTFLVPHSVINELMKLSIKTGPRGRAARVALQYLSLRGSQVRIIKVGSESYSRADDEILRLVKEGLHDVVVATNDEELKSTLKNLGVPVITWWFSKRKFTFA